MLTLHANRTGIAGLERPLTVELGDLSDLDGLSA